MFTCGDNSSFCCGHGEVSRIIFRPTAVETMKGIPCEQVHLHQCDTFHWISILGGSIQIFFAKRIEWCMVHPLLNYIYLKFETRMIESQEKKNPYYMITALREEGHHCRCVVISK